MKILNSYNSSQLFYYAIREICADQQPKFWEHLCLNVTSKILISYSFDHSMMGTSVDLPGLSYLSEILLQPYYPISTQTRKNTDQEKLQCM